MPLLNDAKTCYVGTTPITNIYAGTQLVWPKGLEALDLRAVKYRLNAGPSLSLGIEFQENNNCADCLAMRTTYQFRYTVNQSWTSWLEFRGSRNSGTSADAYCFLLSVGTTDLHGESFELRAKGVSTGPFLIDQNNAPQINVFPAFTC